MSRWARALIVCLTIAPFTGCGDDPAPEPLNKAPEFTQDEEQEIYDESFETCSLYPPSKIAKDLGVSAETPAEVAAAWADGYLPDVKQAALEGCREGFASQ